MTVWVAHSRVSGVIFARICTKTYHLGLSDTVTNPNCLITVPELIEIDTSSVRFQSRVYIQPYSPVVQT